MNSINFITTLYKKEWSQELRARTHYELNPHYNISPLLLWKMTRATNENKYFDIRV